MDIDTDIVVIGSGIAGALAAWSLAQRGANVVVLEAGPRIDRAAVAAKIQAAASRDHTAGYPNTSWAPRPDRASKTPYIETSGTGASDFDYLRVVGGTSWLWTGGCDRMLPSDFRMRSLYEAGVDWPFSYEVLEPFYVEAERELGVAGDSHAEIGSPRSAPFPLPPVVSSFLDGALAERLQRIGIVLHPRPAARNSLAYDGRPQCQGFGTCTPLCPTGAQYCATTHLEKAERLGVRLMENCRVDGFDADASSGRLVSALFQRSDGEPGIARAKFFVLAANGVESPRLLLASTSERFPRGLANTSVQVGRNFMCHLGYSASFETPFPLHGNRGPRFTSHIPQFRDGDFRSDRAAFALTVYNQIDLLTLTADLLRQGIMPPQLDGALRQRAAHAGAFGILIEQLPAADNRITVDLQQRDSAGQPRIRLALSPSAHQERGLVESRTVVRKILAELQATRVALSEVFNAHHLMGTLRMGHDPKSSVTDPFGRCHDHPNLFIAGSSLFPTFGAAGPSLTIAALALRTAGEIARSR